MRGLNSFRFLQTFSVIDLNFEACISSAVVEETGDSKAISKH